MKWNESNIPNLKGKVIIVTGGNSGLGYECVRAFSQKGACVVLACRDIHKGELAKARVDDVTGSVEVMALDLQNPDSIKAFVHLFKCKHDKLDVLLNNAGIMMPPYQLTSLGVESQFATNHLGHFLLTALLLNVIKATPKARVVSVSSLAHRKGKVNLDDINYNEGRDYESMAAYRRSKLANLYFAYELERLFQSHDINALSVVAHPGVAPTNLMNHIFSPMMRRLTEPLAKLILQKVKVGALASIRAAVDGEVTGGDFYGPSGKSQCCGYPVLVNSTVESHDVDMARKLWHYSESVMGVSYPF